MAALSRTAAVVLAAGLSRRYGPASKLYAELDGKPLALHIAQTVGALPLARRFAVCRFGDEELARMFEREGFTVVINPDSARGLSSSLAVGVEAVETLPDIDAVLVCLADMPNVSRRLLQALVGELEGPADIVGSATRSGPPTPPAVFGRSHFEDLMALEGDKGARELLANARLVRAMGSELDDFDTPADFVRS